MTRYDKFSPRSRMPKRPWTVHPVWRGIGCFMMILIPVMAYAGAVLLVQENYKRGWLPMPRELSRVIFIPMLGSFPNLLAYLLVALVLSLVGFGLFTALYSMIYSMVGPSQYGPLDVPPISRAERRALTRKKDPYEKKRW